METRVLFLIFSLLAVATAVSAARHGGALVGGYKPIKNLNDPHVVEIANFAVTEHNKEGAHLEYVKIVKGESQVVAGTNYRLVISAKDGNSAPKSYEAVVYERPWEKFKKLESFKPL